mmetsp:Transcript_934/g.3931  ORF Transcript_934/g.3931 Transcript_934/m.3931 type:complete len:242 (-) Transcript_934:71-796(-)
MNTTQATKRDPSRRPVPRAPSFIQRRRPRTSLYRARARLQSARASAARDDDVRQLTRAHRHVRHLARVAERRRARVDDAKDAKDPNDDDDGDGGRGVVDRAHHRARARGAARSRRRARAVERGRAGRPRRRPRRRRRRKGGSRVHGQVRDGDDVFPARARRSRERGGGARARGRRVSGRRAPTRSTRGRRRRRAVEARQTRRDLERGHRGVVRRRLREIVRRDGRSARSTRIDSVTRLGVG